MTFDRLKRELRKFLESSNVNLGRKTSKTRKDFISHVFKILNKFATDDAQKKAEVSLVTNERIIRIAPKDRQRALDIGKGAHAMTATESMRADEQLNRSPYSGKSETKEKTNE